ncbi:MAG: hypothetical protein ACUVRJ_03310 [Candidatus Villigracilaceae bacterium]
MEVNFEHWPFAPPANRLPEEEERWWEICYTPHPVLEAIESRSQWCVLRGGFQQGKSILLKALKRRQDDDVLVLEDDFLSAPQAEAWQGNILRRILFHASWALRDRLRTQPEVFSRLSKTQLEFLRWAIEKFHGRRAFLRWLDGLPSEHAQRLDQIPFEDLYPTQTASIDVDGQLEELINLCHRLDYQQVTIHLDTSPFLTTNQQSEIRAMLGWLKPMERYGVRVILALPPFFSKEEITEIGRGRLTVLEIKSAPDFTDEVVRRHLLAATSGQFEDLLQLCSSSLMAKLKAMVAEEFGGSPPGPWLKIAEIILETAHPSGQIPLTEEAFSAIQWTYAARYQPLRLGSPDMPPGVWRGYQWLNLDRALYEFLTTLMEQKGRCVNHEIVRTSKSNLHTLASRLKKIIEPNPGHDVYVKNRKGEGYWLENFIPSQIPHD